MKTFARALCVVFLSSVASAEPTAWVSVGGGPLFNLTTSQGQSGFVAGHFNEQVGTHFSDGFTGPGLALDLHQGFFSSSFGGGLLSTSTFLLEAGPRFVYDFRLSPRLPLYLGPSVGVGFLMLRQTGTLFGSSSTSTYFGIAPSVALDVKLVLAERFLLLFRPAGFEFPLAFDVPTSFGQRGTLSYINYDLQLGLGVVF